MPDAYDWFDYFDRGLLMEPTDEGTKFVLDDSDVEYELPPF
jgi:hypothetical protein